MIQDIYFKEQLDFIKEQIKIQTKSNLNRRFGTSRTGESTHSIWYTNSALTSITIIPKKYNIISRELTELNKLRPIQLDPFLKSANDVQELTYKYSIKVDKKTRDIYVTPDNEEITINHDLIKHFKGYDECKFYGTHYNAPVYIIFNGEVIKIVLPIKRN